MICSIPEGVRYAPRQVKVSTWPHFSARLIFASFAETKLSLSFDIKGLLKKHGTRGHSDDNSRQGRDSGYSSATSVK